MNVPVIQTTVLNLLPVLTPLEALAAAATMASVGMDSSASVSTSQSLICNSVLCICLLTHCEVSSVPIRSSAEVLSLLTFQLQYLLEEDYNTVVETSVIKELLLNFGLELKKLCDEFY